MTGGRGETELPSEVRQSALLRWAVENIEVKEQDENQKGMDPERKAQAMKNIKDLGPEWYDAIFGKSDVEVLKELIEVLKKYEADKRSVSAEDVVVALEQIGFLVELTHNANDFPKLGGLPILVNLLNDANEEVRVQVCWIFGKSAANNPEYQEKILKTDVLPKLVKAMASDESKAVQAKALHAISGIVRHSEPAMRVFTANGGFRSLVQLLAATSDRNVQARTVFFMRYCVEHDASGSLADLLFSEGNIGHVLHLLKQRDFDLREKTLSLLQELRKVGGNLFKGVMNSVNASDALLLLLTDEKDWLREEPDNEHGEVVQITKEILQILK